MAQDVTMKLETPLARPRPVSATGARWTLLILLTVGVMIAFVDRTSISAAIADKGFVREFAMTDVDRGFVNSAYFWTYGLFQILMGWLVDRYGVKWPYAVFFAI